MSFPTEIYVDYDLVGGTSPQEGCQKYVRVDCQVFREFHDQPAVEAAKELARLRGQAERVQAWMEEVTNILLCQPMPDALKQTLVGVYSKAVETH